MAGKVLVDMNLPWYAKVSKEVAVWVQNHGLAVADSIGMAGYNELYCIGIILPETRKWKRAGGTFKRRPFIGRIWFSFRETTPEHWIIEVMGEENLEQVRRLAEELTQDFNIDITIRVERNSPNWERFSNDN